MFTWIAAAMQAPLTQADCREVEDNRRGRLRVLSYTPSGQAFPDASVHISVHNKDDAKAVRSHRPGYALPYGIHRIEVAAMGFATQSREVWILQPETVLRLELAVAQIGCSPEPHSIRGKIRGKRGAGDWWVKAVPLRDTVNVVEAPIDKSGAFHLTGLRPTEYFLLVIRGNEILHHRIHNTIETGYVEILL
jgi:hypothetical protein